MLLKIIGNYLLLTPPPLQVPSRFTFLPEIMLLKEIEAFLMSQKVMTDTNKKNKKLIIVKSIHSSFRSAESKINGADCPRRQH